MPQRLADGFRPGIDVKFFADAAEVIAVRADADVHLPRRILKAANFRWQIEQTSLLRLQGAHPHVAIRVGWQVVSLNRCGGRLAARWY